MKTDFSINELSAPHFFAQNFVLSKLRGLSGSLLDFGSRDSLLPTRLALEGFEVTVFDRDTRVKMQPFIAKNYDTDIHRVVLSDGIPISNYFEPESFDQITSVWAIQHNSFDVQLYLAEALGKFLKRGGNFLIVQSFSKSVTLDQRNRADPQLILNAIDHDKLCYATGLKKISSSHFYYEHATTVGRWCSPDSAVAVCHHLTKQ